VSKKAVHFTLKSFGWGQLHQSCAEITVSEPCFVSIIRNTRIDLGDGEGSESFKSYVVCFV
jgi:hypothetical protein